MTICLVFTHLFTKIRIKLYLFLINTLTYIDTNAIIQSKLIGKLW